MEKVLKEAEDFLEEKGELHALLKLKEWHEEIVEREKERKAKRVPVKYPSRLLTSDEKKAEHIHTATRVQEDGEEMQFIYNPVTDKWVKEGTAAAKMIRHFLG